MKKATKKVESSKNENIMESTKINLLEITEITTANYKKVHDELNKIDLETSNHAEIRTYTNISNLVQKYLKEQNEADNNSIKVYREYVKELQANKKDRKTSIDLLSSKFGALKSINKKDFALFLLNEPTKVEDLKETCVNFYSYNVSTIVSNNTTFNDIFGSKDTNAKWAKFSKEFNIVKNEDGTWQNKEQVNTFVLADFEAHALEYKISKGYNPEA